MKAIAIEQFGGPETMRVLDLPVPEPKACEVLIRIHAASVNPVDWKIREGWLKNMFPHEFPLILGWDAAGTVEAVGEEVRDFHVGDEVYAYCRKPVLHSGTFSEYIAMEEEYVALKPNNLSFAEAAAIPLTALTAWQSLFSTADIQKDQIVMIHAGAGGVGSMAIQLAKFAQATVLTTASEQNHEYVKELGADLAIDYHEEDFVGVIRNMYPEGVDLVYDCVGGKTLERSWNCVRAGGWLITIVDFKFDTRRAEEMGIHAGAVFVEPNGHQLKKIADLIENGNLRPPEIQLFSLKDAAKALELSKEGHTKGKIVLRVKAT